MPDWLAPRGNVALTMPGTLFDFDAEAYSRSIVRVYPHGQRGEMVNLQEMEDHTKFPSQDGQIAGMTDSTR